MLVKQPRLVAKVRLCVGSHGGWKPVVIPTHLPPLLRSSRSFIFLMS